MAQIVGSERDEEGGSMEGDKEIANLCR